MVCSVQKVKVAVKSAKIGASSHVTNSILKNAAKWSVYASTVTYSTFTNLVTLLTYGSHLCAIVIVDRQHCIVDVGLQWPTLQHCHTDRPDAMIP